MKFSVETQSFYADGLNFGETMPDDAVELTAEQELSFYQAVNNGCYIYQNNDGLKASEPRPDIYHSWDDNSASWIMTSEATARKNLDIQSAAMTDKQQRIDATNTYINSKQWQGKATLGRLKSDELAQYNLWLDYLDALEAVDTSSAPDINWPTPPSQ